jgi:transcriptional regulator of heat shock response
MDERQSKLLVAIIDQFIQTAVPVGSKRLLEAGYFSCSSATIRSEMLELEDQGYLEQPHVSAGRIPTAKGYRSYVQSSLVPSASEKAARRRFASLRDQYLRHKDQERVFEAVALLSHMIPNVAFASVPHKERVYYLGLCNVLKQPEFQANPSLASGIAEVLEEHLHDLLESVEIDEKIRYYIGEEHLLPQIQSCSLMVTSYAVRGERGTIGILGPMRMDYAYSTVALDMAAGLLRSS